MVIYMGKDKYESEYSVGSAIRPRYCRYYSVTLCYLFACWVQFYVCWRLCLVEGRGVDRVIWLVRRPPFLSSEGTRAGYREFWIFSAVL